MSSKKAILFSLRNVLYGYKINPEKVANSLIEKLFNDNLNLYPFANSKPIDGSALHIYNPIDERVFLQYRFTYGAYDTFLKIMSDSSIKNKSYILNKLLHLEHNLPKNIVKKQLVKCFCSKKCILNLKSISNYLDWISYSIVVVNKFEQYIFDGPKCLKGFNVDHSRYISKIGSIYNDVITKTVDNSVNLSRNGQNIPWLNLKTTGNAGYRMNKIGHSIVNDNRKNPNTSLPRLLEPF